MKMRRTGTREERGMRAMRRAPVQTAQKRRRRSWAGRRLRLLGKHCPPLRGRNRCTPRMAWAVACSGVCFGGLHKMCVMLLCCCTPVRFAVLAWQEDGDAEEADEAGASSGDDMDADTAERSVLDARIAAVLRATADARATAAQARATLDQLKFRVCSLFGPP